MKTMGSLFLFSSGVIFLTACGSATLDVQSRQGPANADVATLVGGAPEVVIPADDPELDPNYVPPRYQELLLNAGADMFCPGGYSYSTTSKLCVSESEAFGPFTAKMIEGCKKWGGGPACDERTWSRSFAEKLRGAGECPDGATKSDGLCVEGDNAFGPFTKEHVDKCKAAGGGPACETMRWGKAFALKTLPGVPSGEPATGELAGVKIAIDSGHGRYQYGSEYGFDVGAVSPFYANVVEWERNLEVAEKLKAKLEAKGAKVTLLKYPNVSGVPYLELEEKGARAAGHHLFISIHHNSFKSNTQGSEVLVHTNGSAADRSLAAAIQRNLVKHLWAGDSSYNRGVKAANLGVLRGVPASVESAVLVEGFFLDTRAVTLPEAKALDLKNVDAVAEGVLQYWVSTH